MKIRKLLKKISIAIFVLFFLLIIGLIINNRICYMNFSGKDTTSNHLSEKEKKSVSEIYNYMCKRGNTIFTGFDGIGLDLIIYNEKYEFLFSSLKEENGWNFIEYDEGSNRNIFRREAKNSQAFAVKVNGRWVGSFATIATYHKEITEDILILFPPQLFMLDEEAYRGIVIHEMAHAFQGNKDNARVDVDEHLNNVCSKYYGVSQHEELIKLEGHYLEEAIKTDNKNDIVKYVKLFLETRDDRRTKCGLSTEEIEQEKELEWLEGMGRYAEYYASQGSSSILVKNILQISDKVSTKADDRYYALGMAQIMVLNKIDSTWQKEVLQEGFTLEESLSSSIQIIPSTNH